MEASPENSNGPFWSSGSPGLLLKSQPDGVLCRLARRGNAGAYDVLYRRYRQPVFAFVFHLLGGRRADDAEDIAQDAFTKAFAAISDQRPEGSFRHWIFTIARHRTFDHLRRSGRTVALIDVEAERDSPVAGISTQTEECAERNAELDWLVGAVRELPERQREALVMKELGGLSHAEIADEMGTTVSATKKLISRGRAEVSQAACDAGYRSHRRLGRELAFAAPVLPLAAIGVGIVIPAATGGAAGGTAVATIFAVIAVGSGAVVADVDRNDRGERASPERERAVTIAPASVPIALAPQAASAVTPAGDGSHRTGEAKEKTNARIEARADRNPAAHERWGNERRGHERSDTANREPHDQASKHKRHSSSDRGEGDRPRREQGRGERENSSDDTVHKDRRKHRHGKEGRQEKRWGGDRKDRGERKRETE